MGRSGVLNRGEISPWGEILGSQGGNESIWHFFLIHATNYLLYMGRLSLSNVIDRYTKLFWLFYCIRPIVFIQYRFAPPQVTVHFFHSASFAFHHVSHHFHLTWAGKCIQAFIRAVFSCSRVISNTSHQHG